MSPLKKKTFLEKIQHNSEYLEDKKLILACSGGPDSMVLLDLLRRKIIKNHSLVVAHVNHQLRESARRDEKIVQDYCKKHNIPLEILSVDVKKWAKKAKQTLEEYARNTRIQWLDKVRKEYDANTIITAHHADDQAETLLYRITKWTSITGLIGIEENRDVYCRPLLNLSKQEILAFAKKNKIPYWHDETNDDTSIPRNFLRHEIIDKLRTINPEINVALNRLSQSARELKTSFDIFFAEVIRQKSFELNWYYSLPLGFQHELLRLIYETSNGSTHGLSTALMQELDRFLSTRTGGIKEVKKMKLSKRQGKVLIG